MRQEQVGELSLNAERSEMLILEDAIIKACAANHEVILSLCIISVIVSFLACASA